MEVLGDNNKDEEEDAEEVEATLVEACVTLDRADNNDNADNARLNITSSCDNDECQTLEEQETYKNSHLVEVGPEEANSCSPCKRQFKCADNLMDRQKRSKSSILVPVPGVDRAKIDAYSLHAVIVEEYRNGQFKLSTFTLLFGTKYQEY